ncbi:MAG: response regulator [Pseudomonadota bacterium]
MTDALPILVAEDNDFVRTQICKYLEDADYQVDQADSGDSALAKVKSNKVAMAIVDVRMEPGNGLDFISAVQGYEMDIPVILVTGDDNPDILKKAGELKVSAMLTKPVEKDRLLKAVERVLTVKNKKQEM